MFCKNCGAEFQSNEAVMCVKCGVQKGMGVNYCQNCGQTVQPGAEVCLNCGVSLKSQVAGADAKSKMVAGLLGIFLGCFGVHNFYLGYTSKAVIQLVISVVGLLLSCCTLGISAFLILIPSIWGLVEGIMILTGSIKTDAKGNLLKD